MQIANGAGVIFGYFINRATIKNQFGGPGREKCFGSSLRRKQWTSIFPALVLIAAFTETAKAEEGEANYRLGRRCSFELFY